MAGQGSSSIASCCGQSCTMRSLHVCGLALSYIRIGRLANGWPSKWDTTNGHGIWSQYFCPVNVPSRTCQSSLQFREKHHQTNTISTKRSCVHNMFLLKCCVSRCPYVDVAINWIQQNTIFIRPVHTLLRPGMVTCPLKPGCFVPYVQ